MKNFIEKMTTYFQNNPIYFYIAVAIAALIVITVIVIIVLAVKRKKSKKISTEYNSVETKKDSTKKSSQSQPDTSTKVVTENKNVSEKTITENKTTTPNNSPSADKLVADKKSGDEIKNVKADISEKSELNTTETDEESKPVEYKNNIADNKSDTNEKNVTENNSSPENKPEVENASLKEDSKPKEETTSYSDQFETAEKTTSSTKDNKSAKNKPAPRKNAPLKKEADDEKTTAYAGKWVIFKNKENGSYSFELRASNGEKLLSSIEYTSLSGAKNGIKTHKNNIAKNNIVISQNKKGQFYFRLLNGSKQLLCLGETYPTRNGCESAVESVRRFAETAVITVKEPDSTVTD
mgnify:CR=1 FL=1